MRRTLVPCALVLASAVAAAGLAASDGATIDEIEALLRTKVALLQAEADELRVRAAKAELDLAAARRELDELRRFVRDHREFGDDFARYEALRAAAEGEAAAREREESRKRRDAALAEHRARVAAIDAERERDESVERRLARYRDAGFTTIGSDVFVGRMSFSYPARDAGAFVDYDPIVGLYYRPWGVERLDFGHMTISGAILSAAQAPRNVAIAITFYDEAGNQVGSETVQIEGALPDIPYPFTSAIDMALDRPFSSSSTYVLQAEPAQ